MSIEEIKDHQSESDSFREWFRSEWERNKGSIDDLLEHNKTLSDNLAIVLEQNQRLVEALEYADKAIYTQHCTMNHMENTEHEKGQISGLIQAANILRSAKRNATITAEEKQKEEEERFKKSIELLREIQRKAQP